ncbi:MAG TPA: ATP-binding protein [Pyrinomonadaceae bacterium]|nr:ATP-binding protein [Pyrinomonadaceae bacterium]
MWIPKSEEDVTIAAGNGSLEESVIFDAKREIPPKNPDTAKDVAALANTAGGVLLYGLDEDAGGRPTVLTPITLDGQRERLEQIIRTSIDEVPTFSVSTIPTKTDSSKGYLVLLVPPSERAPHMVVVKGEQRFYGRAETSNYVLSQAEVARLYERRRTVGSDILPLLEKVVKETPLLPDDQFAHLHIVARPVLRRDDILSKALSPQQSHPDLLRELVDKVNSSNIFRANYVPDIQQSSSGWKRKPEGYLSKLNYGSGNDNLSKGHVIHLQVNLDGSAYLFCGRAGENQRDGHPPKWFFSGIVAGNTTKLLALLGELYDRSSYFGMVDFAVAVTGLDGCVPYETRDRFHSLPRFEGSEYKKAIRASALTLLSNPKQVASDLLMPLIESISQSTDNPFKEEQSGG